MVCACMHAVYDLRLCAPHHRFSSCFIMAHGERRRQRTFLELRLQTVSNFLAPVTSICADVQLFGALKKTETDTDGSSSGGGRALRRLNLNDQSCILRCLYPEKNLLMAQWLWSDGPINTVMLCRQIASECPEHSGSINGAQMW